MVTRWLDHPRCDFLYKLKVFPPHDGKFFVLRGKEMTDCQLPRRTRRALYKITKFISSPSLRRRSGLSQISFANFFAR